MKELKSNLSSIISELKSSTNLDFIESIRIQYLGKKGTLVQEMQKLGNLSPDERKEVGQELNILKTELVQAIADRESELKESEINAKLLSDYLDVTLPARETERGSIHPISRVISEVTEIFANMGFSLEHGPEVETEHYNFTALNIPEHHPAREMHDTFYMRASEGEETRLLRTHTSNVQIRSMSQAKPPFKFISIGRVYRNDYDMTHSPMFHQIEGVYIDKKIDMRHLKGCLKEFLQLYFNNINIEMRLRPSFFPFTEPSAEVDISINGSKWLEILGCGMVHPNVLKNIGVNPKEYQGFAFGMGIERIAMLKYGIKDLRTFFDCDIRWLKNHSCGFYNIPKLIWGL